MRKRNTAIRMITVRPAQPRRRMVLALARRLGIGTDAQRAAEGPSASPAASISSKASTSTSACASLASGRRAVIFLRCA